MKKPDARLLNPTTQNYLRQQWTRRAVQPFIEQESGVVMPIRTVGEDLNGDVKQGVHSKAPSRSFEQLHHRVLIHLHKLQKLPTRVRSYFQHPELAYAR